MFRGTLPSDPPGSRPRLTPARCPAPATGRRFLPVRCPAPAYPRRFLPVRCPAPAYPRRLLPARRRSRVVADGCPQTVTMQRLCVSLHGLTRAGGDHCPALVVHVQHQLLCLRLRVPEHGLKHVRHVRHQVYRVIPDDRDPWHIGYRLLLGIRPLNLCRRDAHGRHLPVRRSPVCPSTTALVTSARTRIPRKSLPETPKTMLENKSHA